MKTEITETNDGFRGEIFFDADCPLCVGGVRRVGGLFTRRNFKWVPMQTPGTAERLEVTDSDLRAEMKLLCADGKVLGGIDTWIFLFRSVWWLWPLGTFLLLPGIHSLASAAYRWLARNRYCFGGRCPIPPRKQRHRAFFELP